MKDLREQLMARFGAPADDNAEQSPPAADRDDPLGPDAHLGAPWIAQLRVLGPAVGVPVKDRPSLNAAKQLTDKTLKALKTAGRKRDGKELSKLRGEYLKKREKVAWARIKDRFSALALPEKAYRALKQGNTDPEKALTRLKKLAKQDEPGLRAMGAARLREALLK